MHLGDVGFGALGFEFLRFRGDDQIQSRVLTCQLGLLVHAADVSGSFRAAACMGR